MYKSGDRPIIVLDNALVDDGYQWYKISAARDVRAYLDTVSMSKCINYNYGVYDVREDLLTLLLLKFSV